MAWSAPFSTSLESLLLPLVEKLLHPYIDTSELRREKLRVGVWQGNIVLTDVALRPDALDGLELPLTLTRGRVGRMQLCVPWSRLRSESIELLFEDVVLEVRLSETPDPEAFLRRERLQKRLHLDADELLRGLRESVGADDGGHPSAAGPPAEGFLGRLGRAMLDNLRLTLVRVDLRCEEASGSAWGVSLQRFEMKSTGSDGQPEYQRFTSDQPWLHKVLIFVGASIYSQTADAPALAADAPALATAARAASSSQGCSHEPTRELRTSVVLPATDVELMFRILRAGARAAPSEPRMSCTCRLARRIDVQLTSRQCVRLLQLSSHLSRLAQRERYARFRTQITACDSQPPLPGALWRYAADCVNCELEERRRWRGWAATRAHGHRRREYLPLWRQFLRGESPTPGASRRLVDLEEELKLRDILLFRALARRGCTHALEETATPVPRPYRTRTTPVPLPQIPRSTSDGHLDLTAAPAAQETLMTHTRSERDMASAMHLRRHSSSSSSSSSKDNGARAPRPAPSGADSSAAVSSRIRLAGWQLWLRNSRPAAKRANAESQGADADAHASSGSASASVDEDGAQDGLQGDGYSPVHVSHSQQQQLRQWMDRAGVLHAEADEVARQAPAQWKLQLNVHAVRVRLQWDSVLLDSTQTISRLPAGLVLDLGMLELGEQSDLAGSASSHLTVGSLALSAQAYETSEECSQRTTYPIINALASAPRAQTAAIVVSQRSWPATVGEWLPESATMRAGSNAGSQLDVSVIPICVNVQPEVARELLDFVDRFGLALEAPCGPLLAEPPHNSSFALKLGSSMMLLPCEGHGILQLDTGQLELQTRDLPATSEDPQHDAQHDATFEDFQRDVLPQHTRVKFLLRSVSLRLRERGPAGHSEVRSLIHPFTVSLVMMRAADMRTEQLTARVSAIKLQCNLMDLIDVGKALRALTGEPLQLGSSAGVCSQPAKQPPNLGVMQVSAMPAAQRAYNVQLEGFHARVSSLGLSAAVDVDELVGTASGSWRGAGLESAAAQLTVARLDADLGISSADAGSLHLRLQGIVCSHSQRFTQTESEARVTSARAFIARAGCAEEAAACTLTGTPHTSAIAVSMTVDSLLQDLSLTSHGVELAVVDAETCVRLADRLRCSCLEVVRQFDHESVAVGLATSRQQGQARQEGQSPRLQALAVRADLGVFLLRFSMVSNLSYPQGAGTVSLGMSNSFGTILLDRVGGCQFEVLVQELHVLSAIPHENPCMLLHPARLYASGSMPLLVSSSPGILRVDLGELLVELTQVQREQCSRALAVLASASELWESTVPAADAAVAPPAKPFPSFILHFSVGRISLDVRPLVAIQVIRLVFDASHRTEPFTALCSLSADTFAVEQPACGTCLLRIGSRGSEMEPARIDVVLESSGTMTVGVMWPQVDLHVCPFQLVELVPLAVLLRTALVIEMPAASDAPFAVNFTVGMAHLVIADELDVGHARLRLDAACSAQASTAGGLHLLLSRKMTLEIPHLSVELRLGDGPNAVLVSPFCAAMRLQSCRQRMRVVAESADLLLQASVAQLKAVAELLEATAGVMARLEQAGERSSARSQIPATAPVESLMASDSVSETSEYFDAREDTDEAPTHPEPSEYVRPVPSMPDVAAQAIDVQCEARLGLLIVTLLDEVTYGVSTPVLQFTLDASRSTLSQTGGSGLVLKTRLQAAMYHYSREPSSTAQRWEPVLASCRLDIGMDTGARSLEISSYGPIELDVGTRFLGSMLQMHKRILSAAAASGEALTFAPFVLSNETGTPMVVWIDGDGAHADGQALIEVSPGSAAQLPASPAHLQASGRKMHVMLRGFHQLDLRPLAPPYAKRCRLWPAGGGGTMDSAIINVLLDSHEKDGVEHCTLYSRFVLVNSCSTPTRVTFYPKDSSQQPHEMVLEPNSRQSIPLTCHHGWLTMGAPSSRHASRASDAGRLEVSAAALEVLAAHGRHPLRSRDANTSIKCVLATVSSIERPPHGWAIYLHEPLVLRNALLCELDYELSEVAPAASAAILPGRVHVGTLAAGASVPFYAASTRCVLRTSRSGFRWSQRIHIDLSDEAVANASEEHELVHGPSPGNEGTDELCLVLRLAGSTGLRAEVSGHVWVFNECHAALRLAVLNGRAAAITLEPASSTPTANAEVSSIPAGGVLLPMRGSALPEVLLREECTHRRPRAGCFVSLPDLLRLGEEELLLDVGEERPSAPSSMAPSAVASSRLLHLGVKLQPLPVSLGTSFMLTISPRTMVLNRTGRPLLYCQRGCSAHAMQLGCEEDAWVPVHWLDPKKPREILLRRLDPGAEWSGGVCTTLSATHAEGRAEETLRLRNLETGEVEFLRLVWHKLTSRATSGLIIEEASAHDGVPIVIHNQTRFEVRFKQAGVPLVTNLAAGEQLAYAWDEPTRQRILIISVTALAVRFRCDATPCRITRPRLAPFFGRAAIELHTTAHGAAIMVVLRHASAQLPPPRLSVSARSPSSRSAQLHAVSHLTMSPHISQSPPISSDGAVLKKWRLQLQLSEFGATLLDHDARELLHLSLRGLRIGLAHDAAAGGSPLVTLSLALASMQLDCQLPRDAAREEVLLGAGVAAPGDAVELDVAVALHDSIIVVQRATLKLQEVSLRLDEEALNTVAAAMLGVGFAESTPMHDPSQVPAARGANQPWPQRSAAANALQTELGGLLRERQQTSQRLFVQKLRLAAVPLKFSLQRASRPDADTATAAADGDGPSDGPAEASVMRWLRWLGITLIGLDEVPLSLPEVTLLGALLPAESLLLEVQQRYGRALLQQAYKVLPSAALLGDPYGLLRTLRQGWHKHWQTLRHTPWPMVPAVAVQSAAMLLRAGAASLLMGFHKSQLALSSSLDGLLSEQTVSGVEIGLPEALLLGVGGLARETSRAIEAMVQRIDEQCPLPIPPALQAVLGVFLVPVGFVRAAQRLVLLLTLGTLSWMRTTTDAVRSLLMPAMTDTGRARAARPCGAPALYLMCGATVTSRDVAPASSAPVEDGGVHGLVCAELQHPAGTVLLLTRTRLRCLVAQGRHASGGGVAQGTAAVWDVPLAGLLLVQQRGCDVQMLTLTEAEAPDQLIARQQVSTRSEDEAARLHELLRLAALNARSSPGVSTCRLTPLVRASVLLTKDL